MSIPFMWVFAKENIIKTVLLSSIVVALYVFGGWTFLAIPFVPLASVGTAVAFYVGFKNNQAYDRLWEARRLWGGFTNTSRILTSTFISLVDDKEQQRDFLMRHLVYINVVRLQLRKTIPWATSKDTFHQNSVAEAEELKAFDLAIVELFERYGKMDVYERVKHSGNIASTALSYQFKVLTKLKKDKMLDEYEHSDLTKLLGELFNLQGGCERIKSTPLFRQYSLFSRIFVELFIFLLPFGLLTEMNKMGEWGVWMTIPFSVLISWVFMTMEQIGEFSENPFDNGVNDIPIATICRNIEIDVLEMLGEKNLPSRLEPFNQVML